MPRLSLLIICLLVVAASCSDTGESRLARAVDEANAALRRGDVEQAAELVRRAAPLADRKPNEVSAWRLRLVRGDILLASRDLDGAAEIGAAPVPDAGGFETIIARQKYLQARIAYARRRLPEALDLADAALRNAGDRELELDVRGFRGQLLLQTGNWDEGEAQLQTVASRAAASRFDYIEAMASTSMGMGKSLRNRCDEAIAWFERVLTLSAVSDTPVYARALYNSGMCYSRLGQFDRAAAAQLRAIAATEKRPSAPDYEQALGQLGNTYILEGRTREGLAYLQRAFSAASSAKLSADATLWAKNLAAAYVELRQWDEAERYNEEAQRLWATTRSGRPVYNTLTSAAIAAGRGKFEDATRLYEEALRSPDSPPSVLWDAHFGLANVAIATRHPERASREFESTLDIVERTRAGLLRTDYKLSYLTQLIAFYRAYVEHLVAQGQRDRALEIADASRARVLGERQGTAAPPRVSASAMRRLAADWDATLLSFWLTPRHSYLWVVQPDAIRMIDLPPAAEIESLVREHQAAIANALVDPLASPAGAGDRLYQLLIGPVVSSLSPDARIVIVPDGALHAINFETLPVGGGRRHYWIEDVEVQVAPSLAALTSRTVTAAQARTALVIGDPTPRPPDFPALKFAATEMAGIRRRLGADRVTVLERDRATPAAYREAQPARFGLVHFAAHAMANVESPLDSAVILSGPDNLYKLYARDVAALPLSADLVTVSACRSAGERTYSGEGLIGFAWAFLRAGARRVVAGLWDADDRSAAELMDGLYAELAAGQPPAHALRQAKLALIRKGGGIGSPYSWGAFEIFTIAK